MEVDPAAAFAIFDKQDSGCLSYGVERRGRRLFVKTATTTNAHESLGRAIRFHEAVRHPAIVAPLEVIDTQSVRQLVYPWHDGLVLNHATIDGSDRSGLLRFRKLPRPVALDALDRILDAHAAVAAAGFVSVDLYDGCFLYDFDRLEMHLIDLDEYRPAPFTVTGARLPGSTRYMAPEELARGGVIDERTMVFHLGRTIRELLGEDALDEAQQDLVAAATEPSPSGRLPTVEAMISSWRRQR